jgi:hypothetical protein
VSLQIIRSPVHAGQHEKAPHFCRALQPACRCSP